jgi:hypothetical protein
MPLDPETNPKAFLTILIAAGALIFKSNVPDAKAAFVVADEFVVEAESRFGKLNP